MTEAKCHGHNCEVRETCHRHTEENRMPKTEPQAKYKEVVIVTIERTTQVELAERCDNKNRGETARRWRERLDPDGRGKVMSIFVDGAEVTHWCDGCGVGIFCGGYTAFRIGETTLCEACCGELDAC